MAEPGERPVAGEPAQLSRALRRRGHRCAVLEGADGLTAHDYDVWVQLGGPSRRAPGTERLSVLWDVGDAAGAAAGAYDIVLAGDPGERAERFAERLVSACERHAAASGYKRRIEPGAGVRR